MTGPKREVLWGPKGRAGPCLGFLSKHTVCSINCIVPQHHPSTDQIQENTGAGGLCVGLLAKNIQGLLNRLQLALPS